MGDLISRQAAIDCVNHVRFGMDEMAFGIATTALLELPSEQPEVTEEAVKDYCRKRCLTILTNDHFHKLTSAQPEPIRLHVDHALTEEEYKKLKQKIADSPIVLMPYEKPKIIHCKDCKYVGTDATCCLVCNREGMGLRPYHVYHDDYCSYAERRQE